MIITKSSQVLQLLIDTISMTGSSIALLFTSLKNFVGIENELTKDLLKIT